MYPREKKYIPLTTSLSALSLPFRRGTLAVTGVLFLAACSFTALAQEAPIHLVHGADTVDIQPYAGNIVGVHIMPGGKSSPRTLVMDPSLHPTGVEAVRVDKNGAVQTLSSPEMKVVVTDNAPFSIEVQDAQGKTLITLKQDAPGRGGGGGGGGGRGAQPGGMVMVHDENENLWGIHGTAWHDDGTDILRNIGGTVAASFQGDGGAPFFFTTHYGVLVDSDGGSFAPRDEQLRFQRGSRPDSEYFVIVGEPMKTMAGLAALTGRPPMPPKWTLGFMNSQWGSTEEEWRQITEGYEQRKIPVSAFILDFDWKAWGEDDYGEWRWNSTSGVGSVSPNKFPNGASGKFAADMLTHGIHLVGILKPRLVIVRPDGEQNKSAAYATDHNFWYPNEVRSDDYFSHRLGGNIDFGNADARKWFWDHLVPAFQTGMAGWWNDEADQNGNSLFNNFQFMNMGRMLYEGQRSISNKRAWSINRNYYLGAVRYGYAEWSGDITSGFQSMQYQRRRMIASMNLGESMWSMDTGGFGGHPVPENYARWMEFGAFVPIFRVHGGNNEKRQPWVYGPVAEAAAKKAVRLRFDLLPYIYSNARVSAETGIGLVRPLFWAFPDDDRLAEESRAWMFGDALLASPIVERNAPHKFYLPAGSWLDYFTGKPVEGGREISVTPDSTTWQDIPLYVRAGSILATQPAQEGNELSPKTPLIMDIFPSSARAAGFLVYDDDGDTYDYEKGGYFRQEVTATQAARTVDVQIASATGSFKPHFPTYVLRVHQAGTDVTSDAGKLTKFASDTAFQASAEPGWFSTTDRFGAVTEIRVATDAKQQRLRLALR